MREKPESVDFPNAASQGAKIGSISQPSPTGNPATIGCVYSCTGAFSFALYEVEADRIITALLDALRPEIPRKTVPKDWNQELAAQLIGVSTRQLRRYQTNPPDADWPGWEDPVALGLWKNKRDDRRLMHQALANSLRYREGVTEAHLRRT